MLTILEDNWDVWTSEATLQLKWSIKALDPVWYGEMDIENELVSEQVDKYTYSGRMGRNRKMDARGLNRYEQLQNDVVEDRKKEVDNEF